MKICKKVLAMAGGYNNKINKKKQWVIKPIVFLKIIKYYLLASLNVSLAIASSSFVGYT